VFPVRQVPATACPWWQGLYQAGENNTSEPTLIACLDQLHITGRDAAAPLRIPVLDRFHDRGTVSLGKVESGTIRVGQKVRGVQRVDACCCCGPWEDWVPYTTVACTGMG
jgi:translation elongation factor EF-1alpha